MNAADFPPIRTAEEQVDTPANTQRVEKHVFSHTFGEPGSETEESFLQVPPRTKVYVKHINKGIAAADLTVAGNSPRKKTQSGRPEHHCD